jgi:hypothetical protein
MSMTTSNETPSATGITTDGADIQNPPPSTPGDDPILASSDEDLHTTREGNQLGNDGEYTPRDLEP